MDAISEKHAERGAPSYVWRAGQDRRLAMIRQYGNTRGWTLVDGVGVGAYASHLMQDSAQVFGSWNERV